MLLLMPASTALNYLPDKKKLGRRSRESNFAIRAYKGKEGPCLDQKQAVIYNGPWRQVVDDDGHTLRRGVRTAVCGKTFDIYTRQPYADQVTAIQPAQSISEEQASSFDCRRNVVRDPRETKGLDYQETKLPGEAVVENSASPGVATPGLCAELTEFPQLRHPPSSYPFRNKNIARRIKAGIVGMDEFS